MANPIDYAGMLTGISQDPQMQATQLLRQPSSAGIAGIAQANNAGRPERLERARRGLGGLMGKDLRSPSQKAQEELSKIGNPTTPEQKQQVLQLLTSIGDPRAVAYSKQLELEKKNVESQVYLSEYVAEKYPELPKLAELVKKGIVTSKNLKDFVPDSETTTSAQFGGSGLFVDGDGNYFYGTQVKDPLKQTTKSSLSPLDPSGPARPVGGLSPVGSSGETGEEKQERLIKTTKGKEKAKEFTKNKAQAVGSIPSLLDNKKNIEEAQKILETLPTGGPINLAAYGIEDFLGRTSGDRADFERVLAMEVYKSLKPIFGGVISEGERKSLQDIAATVKRGNKANSAIIKRLIKNMNQRISQAELYSDSDDFEEYNAFVKNLLKEDKEPVVEEQATNWSDL